MHPHGYKTYSMTYKLFVYTLSPSAHSRISFWNRKGFFHCWYMTWKMYLSSMLMQYENNSTWQFFYCKQFMRALGFLIPTHFSLFRHWSLRLCLTIQNYWWPTELILLWPILQKYLLINGLWHSALHISIMWRVGLLRYFLTKHPEIDPDQIITRGLDKNRSNLIEGAFTELTLFGFGFEFQWCVHHLTPVSISLRNCLALNSQIITRTKMTQPSNHICITTP